MSLATPETVQTLQRTLYLKAKRGPTYRFYALYDKVYLTDILWTAWEQVRENKGSAGVDGQTIEDIEKAGKKPKVYTPSSSEMALWKEGMPALWDEIAKDKPDVVEALKTVKAMLQR